MKIIEVLITCPNQLIAVNISNKCLEQQLVACANISSPIQSYYHWNGNIESEQEIILSFKTRKDLFSPLSDIVEELHPYDIPAIFSIDIEQVNTTYLEWVYKVTRI